jgi:hypothetical protein
MIWRLLGDITGTLVVLFTLREVFRDLFHPTLSGSLSDAIGSAGLRIIRLRPSLRSSIGPLSLVSVVFCWVALITFGFALIYISSNTAIPHLHADRAGLPRQFVRSLYMSLGTLATYQTFDTNPSPDWLRLIVCLEGVIGVSMITASVSWTVLLYPALARTRWMAKRIGIFVEARKRCGLSTVDDPHVYSDFTRALIELRIDLTLFPILLAFYPRDPAETLASHLPHLVHLAEEGCAPGCSATIRLAAGQLDVALDEFCDLLAQRVVMPEPTHRNRNYIFRAFAEREGTNRSP